MSSQQYSRPGIPPGMGKKQIPGGNTAMVASSQPNTTGGTDDSSRDPHPDHSPYDRPSGGGGAPGFRDDKQETVVVRPYPQVHGPSQGHHPTLPQHLPLQQGMPVTVSAPPPHIPQGLPLAFTEGPIKVQSSLKSPMPSRVIAPAPANIQGHISLPPKVPSHLTVTMESTVPPTPGIPVATISGQQAWRFQGNPSNLHHHVQIIRSNGPPLQLGSTGIPQHTFTSHLPRGAAAAAVMSSSKGPTVLRPATGPGSGTGPPTVQHIIHQPIQSRPIVTTSTAVLPTVVAPVTATRPQSPVVSSATHSAEMVHGRPGLTVHPPPATLSIQRPPQSRETPTRITLPSHPAIGGQKPQLYNTMAQKPIFSNVTPVAAATVAPILATNTAPSPSTTGSGPHPNSNIVTMAMPSHSSHATAVTTSNIPVAKVVPQPIAHTSPRIQPEYPGERGNLIPISGPRSSPNPITMEARSDRQPVPVQFQYFLPTYPSSSYPLTHTYTPITSSVSTIRQYPVTPQAPSGTAMQTQASVGVASAVHLNPMQLMTVDRIAQINTQNIQPAAMATQGIKSTNISTQGLHTATGQITAQNIQPVPINQQQPAIENKTSVVLADGSTLVANPIGQTFGSSQPPTCVGQTHPQNTGPGAPTLLSSPRPSILRKKPANEGSAVRKNLIPEVTSPRIDGGIRPASGMKHKADLHVSLAPPLTLSSMEALPSHQINEQQPSQPIQTLLSVSAPPHSQPGPAMSAITPPISSMANVVVPPTQAAASSTAACGISSTLPELKIKQEVEPMDTSKAGPPMPHCGAPMLSMMPGGDVILGASPRKKPRKQQHVISTEESEMMETNSTDEEKVLARPHSMRPEKRKSPPKEYIDEEGVRYVPTRARPPVTLLRHYRNPWKAAYHHFQRYSDIRVKEEKKGTLQDVANQKGVVCRAQGWKMHLCAAQLMQLTSLEHDVYSRLTTLQEGLIPKKKAGSDDDMHRINELIQGNMQRCKLVMDQITEARDAMMKVLDHKEKVMKLINKNGGAKKVNKLKRKDKA
ncbi:histone deacetylase complex subunit SAP130-like isoform X1 [Oncorhynchus tshawytscha]|uniref:histone deacetylase complex subunit SAP130-like isoform X1 n=1 Tax=Oncorhynchus tshawytscha TaxID=74940 RepID=UPI001C3DA082|nr:histone deacetylase complex subunit SAP130-like isoform X1 [Oncorhynchus tshawytscha]